MEGGHEFFDNASLVVSLAFAAGVASQVVAEHLRTPGIVVLLVVGVLLGPDVANVVRPSVLGGALQELVGFSVAVILFEGGLHLNRKRLRKEERAIRQLVTWGALATAFAGTLVCRGLMGWNWRLSILFGTLIIVTGPTVITPLLRRLRAKRSVATILEAEGVLIDAVGAITAAVAFEVALSPSGRSVAVGFLDILRRLGFGVGLGVAGGFLIAATLKYRDVVPDGLENVLTLSLTVALFQVSNAILHESGIAAVTVAGIIVGNSGSYAKPKLVDFKEQLTTMLVGMLFILLAADVRLKDVLALGWPGVLTVAAVMLIVRPFNIAVGTRGTALTLKQKAFLAWVGPRGIVAAAVASLFADRLGALGIEGGVQLRALVFLVIAVTVTSCGLLGGLVASLLGVRRRQDDGWVFLGANELARATAHALKRAGEDVVCIEVNPNTVQAAEREGLRIIFGDGLQDATLLRAEVDSRAGVLGMTPNEQLNFMFVHKVRSMSKSVELFVALVAWDKGVTADMVERMGAHVFAGAAEDVALWSSRIRRDQTEAQWWHGGKLEPGSVVSQGNSSYVPIIVRDGDKVVPASAESATSSATRVGFLVFKPQRDAARAELQSHGWEPIGDPEPPMVSVPTPAGGGQKLAAAR